MDSREFRLEGCVWLECIRTHCIRMRQLDSNVFPRMVWLEACPSQWSSSLSKRRDAQGLRVISNLHRDEMWITLPLAGHSDSESSKRTPSSRLLGGAGRTSSDSGPLHRMAAQRQRRCSRKALKTKRTVTLKCFPKSEPGCCSVHNERARWSYYTSLAHFRFRTSQRSSAFERRSPFSSLTRSFSPFRLSLLCPLIFYSSLAFYRSLSTFHFSPFIVRFSSFHAQFIRIQSFTQSTCSSL